MKGFKIVDIIKVVLDNILIELHFNVENLRERLSFKLSISDDGETIIFVQKRGWVRVNEIRYEAYSTISVDRKNDELAKLIDNEIKEIQYGIGETLDTHKAVVYYVKIATDKTEFLFFNNGDEGAYSFDKIDEILANDIYGYQWTQELQVD